MMARTLVSFRTEWGKLDDDMRTKVIARFYEYYGTSVGVTGVFSLPRASVRNLLAAIGVVVSENMRDADVLLVGDMSRIAGTSRKLREARALGVPRIPEETFIGQLFVFLDEARALESDTDEPFVLTDMR